MKLTLENETSCEYIFEALICRDDVRSWPMICLCHDNSEDPLAERIPIMELSLCTLCTQVWELFFLSERVSTTDQRHWFSATRVVSHTGVVWWTSLFISIWGAWKILDKLLPCEPEALHCGACFFFLPPVVFAWYYCLIVLLWILTGRWLMGNLVSTPNEANKKYFRTTMEEKQLLLVFSLKKKNESHVFFEMKYILEIFFL